MLGSLLFRQGLSRNIHIVVADVGSVGHQTTQTNPRQDVCSVALARDESTTILQCYGADNGLPEEKTTFFPLVQVHACLAVHSALEVGLLSAAMISRSLLGPSSLSKVGGSILLRILIKILDSIDSSI